MKRSPIHLLSIVSALVFATAACSAPVQTTTQVPAGPTAAAASPTSAPPAATGTPAAAPTAAETATLSATATLTPESSPTENPVHSLGQPVKANSLTIAMIGVVYTAAQLQVTFVAKDTGASPVAVAFIEFSAATPDGKALQSDACFTPITKVQNDYSIPSFSGALVPGENLRGTICWKGTALNGGAPQGAGPTPGIQVAYTPEGTLKPAAAWDVSSAGKVDAPAALASSDFATPPHAQGEAVALKDIAVSFDGADLKAAGQLKNRVVMAHFTLENKGSASYPFGQFLSYSFSFKLPDGSPLGTDFMTPGCQNTLTKVTVPPGKKQSWTVCFVNPSLDPLPSGSLAIFAPNPDQGGLVFWATKLIF